GGILQFSAGRCPWVFVVGKDDTMPDEHLIFDRHALANEAVGRNLASRSEFRRPPCSRKGSPDRGDEYALRGRGERLFQQAFRSPFQADCTAGSGKERERISAARTEGCLTRTAGGAATDVP